MGRLKVKGKAGAAKNYTTRSAAVKKLQCSLADFRRLCILKGIFPREPRNRKKANKGSSAPTSFYSTKDIAYLTHEPILKKLREHKAFAKKLSRAIGRGEWSSAKSLEENKPTYRLDHIIKERYPTFIDALRDIDDALCMIFLFASLPSNSRLPPELIEKCSQLAAEWQLYVLHSRSLRKAFLSIKGIYYQAEVMDQTITWLVPYQFTQNVPTDVDIRVMLTFLELYQVLLSFVFFKLYTDEGLAYPPAVDTKKDQDGAGIGALSLHNVTEPSPPQLPKIKSVSVGGRQVSAKDIHQTIKTIGAAAQNDDSLTDLSQIDSEMKEPEEDFVVHPSSSIPNAALPTLQTISSLPQTLSTNLFAPYTIFLSRETPRSIFEFLARCFGGRIGWPASSGSESPFDEDEPSITHIIVDRPPVQKEETTAQRELRSRRKYVQPQWIVDCINVGRILLEEPYGQGRTLPPHLSPFGEYEGSYIPDATPRNADEISEGEEEDESEDVENQDNVGRTRAEAIAGVVVEDVGDSTSLRNVELAAEAAGIDYSTFEEQVKRLSKKQSRAESSSATRETEHNMNKMMMSKKQRKLYEKMKYSQQKKGSERAKLEQRQKDIERRKRTE